MRYEIDADIREKWNGLVDTVSALVDVPAVLIMHLVDERIEVFCSSKSEGSPYNVGDSEHFADSGLYCEWVINNQDRLLVPNALTDPAWDRNPDIALNMISYLGYPVNYPDGTPFGTVCILDSQENAYSRHIQKFLEQLKGIIEDQILLIEQRHELLETLHGIIPMCASCKKVRGANDAWEPVEQYIVEHSRANVSHGLCPECVEALYPGLLHHHA